MTKRELPKDRSGRELRVYDSQATVLRSEDVTDTSLRFRGHAAVYDTDTLIGGARHGFLEACAPGAFDEAIAHSDVRLLLNHDANLLLARSTSGTLKLTTDGEGLVSEADMAPVSYARDAAILLERGDLNQMSFAFTVKSDDWSTVERADGSQVDHRYILEIDTLYDVSIVTYPAYPTTDAYLASAARSSTDRALLEAILARLDSASPEATAQDDDLLSRQLLAKHNYLAHDLRRSL